MGKEKTQDKERDTKERMGCKSRNEKKKEKQRYRQARNWNKEERRENLLEREGIGKKRNKREGVTRKRSRGERVRP